MKGSARTICVLIVIVAAVIGALADKPKKAYKKFPPSPNGPKQRFIPPLNGPGIPPFQLAPVTQEPPSMDPYACLPKYLCVIENKKGEKRTTIVHGLHPSLRKAKPNVIDPATLPNIGTKPLFSTQDPKESSEENRDREFDDSFLKQQEMAENLAVFEEKRRQFMYQQGIPKQKVFPKGSESVEEDDTNKESKEEEEKSQEEEISKEDKEEEKSVETEVSKEEEKEEAEHESVEDDVEPESLESDAKSRAKLAKYKIKKKAYASKQRTSLFKSRMDDYDDADLLEDQLATVPWDDRVKNDSDPLKPKEIYDKLFGKVLPFQLPSLPKIAKSIPGMSFLASGSDEVTTTTTQRPGIFKRMFKAVTGSGSNAPNPIKKRSGRPMPMRRYKRDAEENLKFVSHDVKVIKQIRDPARQCRMIYPGCDLPYDHIMKMVSSGKVLIENDNEDPTTKKPATTVHPTVVHDDEAEQAIKDKMPIKKSKPIPQMLAQAHLGGKKKVGGPGGLPIFGKNKRPIYDGSEEDYSNTFLPKPKKKVASLPLLPMRYMWGKPTYTVHGKPFYSNGPGEFSGGIMDPATYKTTPPPAPTTSSTTTTERPIFAASPLDKKNNFTIPYQHSVIKLNKTHAVHVLKKKPYNPAKTRTRDAKGRPVSFSTVFTEIAGNSGGIHDFFDKISGAFAGDSLKESGRELTSTFPGSNSDGLAPLGRPIGHSPLAKPTAFPQAPVPDNVNKDIGDGDENSAERDEEDSEEDEEEGDEGNDDQDEDEEEEADEENNDQDEEEEDEEEEDIADDIGEGQASNEVEQKQNPKPKPAAVVDQPEPAEENGQDFQAFKKKPEQEENKNKKKKPPPEEEEENEEDAEDDDEEEEGELDLPDTIPAFIRQSMIEEHKKKQQEKENGGGDDDEEGQQPGAAPQHGGPGGRPGAPGVGGRPGAPAVSGRPGVPGGFGRPSQGGGLFGFGGGQQQGPSQSQGQSGGGLFSFLG